MKEFNVTITETLQKTVTVQADSQLEAEKMVTDAWDHADYVLGAEDFVGVDIKTAEERELTHQKDCMDVLLVQPGSYPKRCTVGSALADLQAAVGGNIEATYPFEDAVALVMNEEGKLAGLPLNRALRTEDGDIYDIVAGDFLVVGLKESDLGNLSPEQMDKFEKLFHQPETFVKMGRSIMALPIPDEVVAERAERAKESAMKSKQADREQSL